VADHAKLSPSARHRWGACPGSVREEAKYPAPPDNGAAIDGTRTHALLEQLIKANCIGPQHLAGVVITDEYGTYTVDQARVDRLQFAIDYIRLRLGEAGAIAEQRVFPDGLVGRADMHGTVDCQIPGKDIYEIIDYKDGMAPVEAENNPQLEQYAVGVLAGMEPKAYPKSFQLTVIQPKLAMRGMPAISTWNISTKGLLERAAIIKAQADACDDPDAPLVPGESQCKYCRAKGACPALAQKVMSEVSVMFQPVTGLDVAQQAANKDPNTMSDAELRQILEAAPLVRQLLEGVEAEVHRRLEAGQSVPGFKLVRGRGSRSWSLDDETIVKKLAAMGAPKSVLIEQKVISPAKAEKLTWVDKAGEKQSLSQRQIDRMHKEYVASQPGKATVAPESDPREAINVCAAPLFTAIEAVVEQVPVPPTIDGKALVMGDILTLSDVADALNPETPADALPEWLALPAWLQ